MTELQSEVFSQHAELLPTNRSCSKIFLKFLSNSQLDVPKTDEVIAIYKFNQRFLAGHLSIVYKVII